MTFAETFGYLEAWQFAREQVEVVHKAFGAARTVYFKNQIAQATVSATNNVADGFGRISKEISLILSNL